MGHEDWDAWDAQDPPGDFAGRVVDRALHGARRRRAVRIGAGLVIVASMAAAVALHLEGRRGHGDVRATARQEVRIGDRAIAVLEPGAHVKWDGDAIEQGGGDVFWRVEPGARFTVHTAAADVTVKGTCFHINVSGVEDAMNKRDAVSGTLGAVMAATAFVGVYEGKVAVSHAGQSVDLAAGQSAQASAEGVERVGGTAALQGTGSPEDEQAWTTANANLADNVRTYRRKLDSLEEEKKKLEKELARAQATLADAGPQKSEYDLSADDWKLLAKEGDVRMRVPCAGKTNDFMPSATTLNKLGLAPQDASIIQQALQASNARSWAVVQPLCSQALGGVDVQRLGIQACVSILQQLASQQNTYDEAVRQVAEIRAGMRAAPGPNDNVPPIERAYLALSSESQNIVSDLSQSLGPEDARRVVFADEGCWWNSEHGVGPR